MLNALSNLFSLGVFGRLVVECLAQSISVVGEKEIDYLHTLNTGMEVVSVIYLVTHTSLMG